MDERVEALAAHLAAARKYGDLCRDVLVREAERATRSFRKDKQAEKAARERLHGLSGAYDADRAERVSALCAQDGALDDETLKAILSAHASTRERLPLEAMDAFYTRAFSKTGEPKTILDLACGLGPVYLSQRDPDSRIVGIDISRACARAVDARPNCTGIWADVTRPGALPEGPFDVALLLKLAPLLEREEAGATARLLKFLPARYAVVSFPTRTLGGRNVGMAAHHRSRFEAMIPSGWTMIDAFETRNEWAAVLARTDGVQNPAQDGESVQVHPGEER